VRVLDLRLNDQIRGHWYGFLKYVSQMAQSGVALLHHVRIGEGPVATEGERSTAAPEVAAAVPEVRRAVRFRVDDVASAVHRIAVEVVGLVARDRARRRRGVVAAPQGNAGRRRQDATG